VKKGAPIIYGGSPAAFDMRYCTARLGAIESIIVAIAGAEIGKSYGLPTHSYLGLSDSKTVDAQGGFESGLGIVFAALAGVNIVSGPGMLASENCQSLEKLVIDNEVCGMAYRILEGISTTCVEAVVDLIARVGSGGHFLGERHTRENLRKEHLIPSEVVDRMTLDAWTKSGSKDTVKRAKERVDSILKEHVPTPLSAEAEVRLDNVFKEIIARHGLLSSLAVSSPDKEQSS